MEHINTIFKIYIYITKINLDKYIIYKTKQKKLRV